MSGFIAHGFVVYVNGLLSKTFLITQYVTIQIKLMIKIARLAKNGCNCNLSRHTQPL